MFNMHYIYDAISGIIYACFSFNWAILMIGSKLYIQKKKNLS